MVRNYDDLRNWDRRGPYPHRGCCCRSCKERHYYGHWNGVVCLQVYRMGKVASVGYDDDCDYCDGV